MITINTPGSPNNQFRHATVIRYLENNMYLVNYHGDELARVYSDIEWKDKAKVVIQNGRITGASKGIENPKTIRV